MIEVPTLVRNKALSLGASQWLTDLPELVAGLAEEWSISVGEPFADGTEAYVTAATLEDGTAAVLKLVIPALGDAARNEATVLKLANGEGCPLLFRDDLSRGALLVERLGRSLVELDKPLEERLEILCSTAMTLWREAPDCGLPNGAEKGQALIEFIRRMWDKTGRPCSLRAVDYSIECAERRVAAHDRDRARLLHGDVHQWNALEAGDGFKLVDPDGLVAEPEYDMGILMREDPVELLQGDPYGRAEWLAARTGLDAEAIWEWGVVERVSTGLLAATSSSSLWPARCSPPPKRSSRDAHAASMGRAQPPRAALRRGCMTRSAPLRGRGHRSGEAALATGRTPASCESPRCGPRASPTPPGVGNASLARYSGTIEATRTPASTR